MLVQILSRVLKNIQSLQGIQMSNELSLLHLGCEKMVSGHWTKKATKVKVYLQSEETFKYRAASMDALFFFFFQSGYSG
jgi:D-ribose pyranose/furanose isomerase RbsD